MKNLLFTALFIVALSTSGFAVPTTVRDNASTAFNSLYRDATDVKWIERDDFIKAEFTWENQQVETFFNFKGELIATSTTVKLEQLPVFAKRAFAKRYSDYTVKQAFYLETPEESAYYLAAENEKQTLIFKVNDNDQLTLFKCVPKK